MTEPSTLETMMRSGQNLWLACLYLADPLHPDKAQERLEIARSEWSVMVEAYFAETNKPRHVSQSIATIQQPTPTSNAEASAIVDVICEELSQLGRYPELQTHLQERKQLGIKRYGVALQANNGRSPLIDLYQELLDAVVYARQAAAEDVIPYCRYRDILISAENVRVLCESL